MMATHGGTTSVQLHAIAGLAPSHTAPFVRLVHEDVVARRHREVKSTDCAILSIELPENRKQPPHLIKSRGGRGRSEYVADWNGSSGDLSPCTAFLPIEVDWIEVQVWNRFVDLAVFLGATQVSLRSMRRDTELTRENQQHERQSRTMWFPLDPPKGLTQSESTPSSLTVQLSISWHPIQTRLRKAPIKIDEKRGTPDGVDEKSMSTIVDPTFRFSKPSSRIEWSLIVAANIRRIFFQGDVDELQLFYNDVLCGDMEGEIENDDDIVVDEDYLQAFRLCQLSAQYLDHCVGLLDNRREEYIELHHTLTLSHRARRKDYKAAVDKKRRLAKEAADLDTLLTTYRKLLEYQGGASPSAPHQLQNLIVAPTHLSPRASDICDPKTSPTACVVSKKPIFLMTWEEREQARKEEKAADKARRIKEEKLRLQRLHQERLDRETVDRGISKLARRRKERSAVVLQRFVRSFLVRRRADRFVRVHHAACSIQKHVRRMLCVKNWPFMKGVLQEVREGRMMFLHDLESDRLRRRELGETGSAAYRTNALPPSDDKDINNSPTFVKRPVQALDLVVVWKKLKQVFSLACHKGTSAVAIFRKIDSRSDSVIDRAEFRAGIRHFGVKIDRQMTRGIIALCRGKCSAQAKPLTLSFNQFCEGFELPILKDSPTPVQATSTSLMPSEYSASSSRSLSVHSSRSSGEGGDHADCLTGQTIEDVAEAVSKLRTRVLQSAHDHLAARKKDVTDYFAFREALRYVFQEFDVDGNGELDLHELVECMRAIGFHVTPENLTIVRECFVSDASSESVSISEFISFALGGMKSASTVPKPIDEELGILGHKLRDAILEKIRIARKKVDSIEEAVRLVFKRAYRTKSQKSCGRHEFARVLATLRLGFSPAQLSRLVLRLDQDNDWTISIDELLRWLRLCGSEACPIRVPNHPEASMYMRSTGYLSSGSFSDKYIRNILLEMAGVSRGTTRGERSERVEALFRKIDENGSKKINVDEITNFLFRIDLASLHAVRDKEEGDDLHVDGRDLAQQILRLIDLNGNGVVTLEEWMGFVVDEPGTVGERYAIIEGVRHTMQDAFADKITLLSWFHSIAGSIKVDIGSSTPDETKVRAREFKNAVRSRFPFIGSKDLDEAVKLLDADKSGWITEKELLEWHFPTRDIEEVTSIISRAWTVERRKFKLEDDAFVDDLYKRFDHDGNGLIARKEVRDGFRTFRVDLSEDETALLIKEFDQDGDGFWNRMEFAECVRRLLPSISTHQAALVDKESEGGSAYSSDKDPGDKDYDSLDLEDFDNEDGSSLGDLYPLTESPIHFDEVAVARSRKKKMAVVEYSEDYDEDG